MFSDDFPEHEHLVILAPVLFHLFRNGGAVLMLVPERDDMEAAAVHVEVDVALLEIRGDGFPDADLRMQRFNGLPSGLADAFAMALRKDEQQFKLVSTDSIENPMQKYGDRTLSPQRRFTSL